MSRTREIFVRQQRTLPGATRAICHQFSGLFSEPHVQQRTCRKAIKIAHEISSAARGGCEGFWGSRLEPEKNFRGWTEGVGNRGVKALGSSLKGLGLGCWGFGRGISQKRPPVHPKFGYTGELLSLGVPGGPETVLFFS